MEDIFGCSQPQTQPTVPLVAPNNDPWAAFENQNVQNNNTTPDQKGQQGSKIGQQRSNVKTPESFLGG